MQSFPSFGYSNLACLVQGSCQILFSLCSYLIEVRHPSSGIFLLLYVYIFSYSFPVFILQQHSTMETSLMKSTQYCNIFHFCNSHLSATEKFWKGGQEEFDVIYKYDMLYKCYITQHHTQLSCTNYDNENNRQKVCCDIRTHTPALSTCILTSEYIRISFGLFPTSCCVLGRQTLVFTACEERGDFIILLRDQPQYGRLGSDQIRVPQSQH